MKISVEISEIEMKEIRSYTRENKKGPAIRKLALDALNMRKRRALSDEIMAGKWRINFPEDTGKQGDRSAWK